MNSLRHDGVLVPSKYVGRGLTVEIKGEVVKLDDDQEEMAVAWAKKIGTPYVDDKVFAENFHKSFSEKLRRQVLPGEVDYSEVLESVQRERDWKANRPLEEKKKQAAERAVSRSDNKGRYGWATVDGENIEIGNYTVEPNSIFMGRGQHPKRGTWKEGPREEDIKLNLSPDAPRPEGNWKEIVWEPNSIWIAGWKDKLQGGMRYVWPSDTSLLKQKKDIEKFEKARKLKKKLGVIKAHIEANLTAKDLKRRKVATVCYLIDCLKFRVGTEKDDDDADTVGASTLRSEHVCFNGDGLVTFNFLGKDSIPLSVTAELPRQVVENLKEFTQRAGGESLFEGVTSGHVNDFFKEVMEGLSAKVFRTLCATEAVRDKLASEHVGSKDPDYVKRQAALMANLEAAIVCNHKRAISRTWAQNLQRKKDRLAKLRGQKKQNKVAVEKLRLQIEAQEKTRDYSLGTSLKNYIDPRIYLDWGRRVGYDWKRYYPATLQRKFSWIERGGQES